MGLRFLRRPQWPHWAMAALLLYGGCFLLATAVAAWRAYTPVPIWDMWHFVSFLHQLATGAGWPAWWEQMNEHRLVLTRALFWIESHVFGGRLVFLIAVNYLLALTSLLTLHAYLRARAVALTPLQAVLSWVVMGAWLLSWVQHENLEWAFQSQFFLAQLVPLIGFYSLYRSTQAGRPHTWFAAACALGVVSIGTMINGIMALPMMVLYAVLLRMGWRRVGLLLVLTAACLALYLLDYQSPRGHGSLLATLQQRPLGMVQYMLQYLGSPFQLLLRQEESMWVGQAFGTVFIALAARQAIAALRSPRTHALELSLLIFIAYVAGIAFATAGGRLGFGLVTAISSRYTTPTMMAWTALAILHWPAISALRDRARVVSVVLLVVLLALLMKTQTRATRSTDVPHLRMTAALALLLDVHDARRTGMLVWDESYAARLARIAAEHGIGVFSHAPLAGAQQVLGQREPVPPPACRATIDSVQTIPQDPRFLLVTGALLPHGHAVQASIFDPIALHLLQPDGTAIGMGLSDRWRKRHVAGEGSPRLRHLTFTAYLQSAPASLPATLVLTAPGTPCSVTLTLPAPQ
ncbi:hypothetical protein [Acidovorax sp. Leaf160]|uniref:hypothetical protein n=1 Tax=Acidovorax sp. Leaf160 TaxID=1736280 RepID=UPI0006FDAF12|nr:hypothetical protein [Acidovorax sp. Leaf160]KQR41410.1 hypothetical protein ASF94_13055 [Acidovorax sp. Leaf160]